MRANQTLRLCVVLLLACPLPAAVVAQPPQALNQRGWKTFQDDRYTFRYPAGLVTTSHRDGVVELHSADGQFRMRASSRISSQKDTLQSAWQQRLKEHGQSVTYKRIADGWFVVTGVEDGRSYYRKHFVSPARTAEFVITYPRSQASMYDPWVRPIEKSFAAHHVSNGAQASRGTERPAVDAGSSAVNETLELPSVNGRGYADVVNVLAEFKVQRVEVASAAPIGEVLAQDPAAGSLLPPGSPIALRVSDGSLASAAASVPAPSAASLGPASPLEPSTAAQDDRVAGAFSGEILRNVVAVLVAAVLLGLLLAAVLRRRQRLAPARVIDPAPAEQVKIAPVVEVDRCEAVAAAPAVAAIEPPAELRFTARLDRGETIIAFADLPEDEEAAIEEEAIEDPADQDAEQVPPSNSIVKFAAFK